MITTITPQFLKDFEDEVAELYKNRKILAPIHLRSSKDNSYENNLIEIFRNINEEDFLYGYWSMHAQCLLKGVPRDELLDEILKGNSISLSFPKYGILCSGIVGSLVGVATGHAWALKKQGKKGVIHHFCGDTAAHNGNFYEAVKYSWGHILPIRFIVEDNSLSVMSPTVNMWNVETSDIIHMLKEYYPGYIKYFKYVNARPHSGINSRVKF